MRASARIETTLIAAALMGATDPVRAIAAEIGYLHSRINALQLELDAVEARISYVAEENR